MLNLMYYYTPNGRYYVMISAAIFENIWKIIISPLSIVSLGVIWSVCVVGFGKLL